MMKSSTGKRTWETVVGFALLLACILLVTAQSLSAAESDALQFNINTSMADNLATLKGKSVTLSLASGQTITGIVREVKGNLLHLTKLSQKEFYDALVAVDRISAIEVKVR